MPEHKHLKLRGKWIEATKEVEISLVERTHVSFAFGQGDLKCSGRVTEDSAPTWAFKHNGVVLASDYSSINIKYDLWYADFEGAEAPLVLNIPDEYGNGPGRGACMASLEEWNKIKEAVKAYNEFFK